MKKIKPKKIKKVAKKVISDPLAISKDILIGELISKYPQTTDILQNHGLHCVGCMISPYESLEAGVAVHDIPLKPLLKELNEFISSPKIKKSSRRFKYEHFWQ